MTLRRSASSVNIIDDGARPPSPDDTVLPSITIVPPSDIDDNDDEDSDNVDMKPFSSPPNAPAAAATDEPASPASPASASDDDTVLPSPSSMQSTARRNSEVSAAVLQLITEQRRFSVSATSAKSGTAGGVTGKLFTCRRFAVAILVI